MCLRSCDRDKSRACGVVISSDGKVRFGFANDFESLCRTELLVQKKEICLNLSLKVNHISFSGPEVQF
jgi:hypothetical protein